MKIVETEVETFSFGNREVSEAKIQASAKAFEILSSSLYSNNVLAIIRELCANAKDSHKAAGIPERPFDVQLPSKLDPSFKVRDYGVGMAHKFVMTRLNTYFDSTKNDSNDEIGGFGLGIKSGFSYTSSYTITTYDGTMRRVYAFQIGSKGTPEISFLAEMASEEPRGVEVSIPVQSDDNHTFFTNAIHALTFYEPKPNIAGANSTDFDASLWHEGTGWKIYDRLPSMTSESYVEMGGIVYPVENGKHDERYYNRNHSSHVCVYNVGIGEVDITPNREQLKMTPRTAAVLKEKAKLVADELGASVQAMLDEFEANDIPVSEALTSEKLTSTVQASHFYEKRGVDLSRLKYRNVPINYNAIPLSISSSKHIETNMSGEFYESYREIHQSVYDDRYSCDIRIPFVSYGTTKIIVGEVEFVKIINHNTAKKLRADGFDRVIFISAKAGKTDKVIKHLKEKIVDFTNIEDWKDVESKYFVVNKVEPDFYTYSLDAARKSWSHYSYGSTKPEQAPFDITAFNAGEEYVYDTFVTTGTTILFGSYSSRNQRDSSLQRIVHALSAVFSDVPEIKKHNDSLKYYEFTVEQVEQLKAAGVVLVKYTDHLKKIADELATEFANNNLTMTLEKYLAPLRDRNPEISITTFYKAVKSWARSLGKAEDYALLLKMNDPFSSSYIETPVDQFFRNVMRHNVKSYIDEHQIKSSKVMTNQFAVDLAEKAPLLSYLITRYSRPEVVEYVKTQLGIDPKATIADPLKTLKKTMKTVSDLDAEADDAAKAAEQAKAAV